MYLNEIKRFLPIHRHDRLYGLPSNRAMLLQYTTELCRLFSQLVIIQSNLLTERITNSSSRNPIQWFRVTLSGISIDTAASTPYGDL